MEWKKVSRVNIITIFFMHFLGVLDATTYNISQDFAFVVFPIAWKKYLERFVSTVFGANLQTASRHKPHKAWSAPRVFCKYPSPLCTMQHTLHNFVLLYNNCKRLPRTRDGVDNGGTVHHLAINNSREMTASKDFKRLEHKNLRHFNFFYQDVICIGHQPSSLSDCCQCWYWGGLPDNFSRNYEIQATRAKVSLWLIWYLLEPWWGVMIHWVWALMTCVQFNIYLNHECLNHRGSVLYESFLCPGGQVMEYCHHWGHIETEKAETKKHCQRHFKDPRIDCFCQSKGNNIYNKITPNNFNLLSKFKK